MKRFFTLSGSFLLAGLLLLKVGTTQAQTSVLYSENCDSPSGALHLPSGWSTIPNDSLSWHGDSSNFSSGYTGASGLYNVVIRNSSPTAVYALISAPFSTVGYNNISILWGARNSSNFSSSGSSIQDVSWSSDGTTWNSLTYSGSISNSAWALENAGSPILLPAAAANKAAIKIRWTANIVSNANGTYRLDDFVAAGDVVSAVAPVQNSDNFSIQSQQLSVFIRNNSTHPVRAEVYNLLGQKMAEHTGTESLLSFSMSNAGVYLVKLTDLSSGKTLSGKVCLH